MCRTLTIKNIVVIFVFGIICHTVLTWLLIFEHEAIVQLKQSSWLNNQSNALGQLILENARSSSAGNETAVSQGISSGFRSFEFKDITNDLAVFYNVYIPKPEPGNENGTSHAADVFVMQMRQIGISHSNKEYREPLKVFYNTMGQDEVIEDKEICEKHEVDCIHMHHYGQGDEDITLQNLYDYCGQFPTHRVIYVHAKGTYHSTHANNENRITMTFSVLNKCSETIKQHNDEPPLCNACGGMFMPVWGPFMSGNMWAARCDLINQLVPPLEFRSHMAALNQAREATPQNLQTALITNVGDYCLGLGRYSNEHWVASHPQLVPCDARGVRLGTPKAPHNEWDSKRWNLIPDEHKKKLQRDKHLRLQDYFLLPGYLFRCLFLYQQVPPPNSWAWEWFPDGDIWKEASKSFEGKVERFVEVSNSVLSKWR